MFAENTSQKKMTNLESPKCTISNNEKGGEKKLSSAVVALSAIKTPENFPTYLKLLTNAQSVERGPVGFAAVCNKECEAYLKALKNGKSIKKELHWVLKNGTAAGKIYAALLIREFDQKAGDEALLNLKAEKAVISYFRGGCEGEEKLSIGELASRLLKDYNY